MEKDVEPRGGSLDRPSESGSYPPIPRPSAQSDRGTWWTLSCYRQKDNGLPRPSFIGVLLQLTGHVLEFCAQARAHAL